MPPVTDAQVAAALAEILTDVLVEDPNQTVHVPGLGTFTIHHQVSQVEHQADGNIVMKPPRDILAFSSEE